MRRSLPAGAAPGRWAATRRRCAFLGRWDAARGTPGNALLVQGVVALALVIAGGFARDGFQLAVDYTAPVFWLFFLAIGIGLFVLRCASPIRRGRSACRCYPVLPALFCLSNAWLLWSSLQYARAGALVGVAVLGAGAAAAAVYPPP